jgi:enamine deaminase RidA (YjgF/YER057c/UK114 family)
MRTSTCVIAVAAVIACWTPASAQSVKHIQTKEAGIASAVWVGDMLYVSGQLPSPVTPADRAKGTPAVYGNTQAQADSVFLKIQALLKEQGLGMGDIVMMRVYMAADAGNDNKLDFAGMNAAYAKFFGTADQPNKPARSTFQVAALVVAGALLEIEVQAARSSPSAFTSDQAAAGQTAYANSCAMCHMPDLRGSGDAPPLADVTFMSSWGTRTTKDLLAYMSAAMPAGGPSLDAGTYESIAAYILKSNGAEAGAQALRTSTVATIRDLVRSAR